MKDLALAALNSAYQNEISVLYQTYVGNIIEDNQNALEDFNAGLEAVNTAYVVILPLINAIVG